MALDADQVCAALLATLALAELQIGGAPDLRWVDINLTDGKPKIRVSKTAAGARIVGVLPLLRDELLSYTLGLGNVELDARVFATSSGGRDCEINVRHRILASAVDRADESLLSLGREMLPERLTPQSLRHTFASILAALGEADAQRDPSARPHRPVLTLRIYAHAMARGEHERGSKALVEGRECGTLRDEPHNGLPAGLPSSRS